MDTKTPDRIAELWPILPDDAQEALVKLAERTADKAEPVDFSDEELAGIEKGREDFKHGRTLSMQEYRADMDAFFERLKAKATTGL